MVKFGKHQDFEQQGKIDTEYEVTQWEQIDPGEVMDKLPKIRNLPPRKHSKNRKIKSNFKRKKSEVQIKSSLSELPERIEFSYNVKPESHESKWLQDSLGPMIKIGWISDILRQIKGGKEASVYHCAGTKLTGNKDVAAKIYRPRMFRNLRNDHIYRQGRGLLDSDGLRIIDEGMLKAVELNTEYGKDIKHSSWIEYEYQAMERLSNAGADVPKPFARGDNAILMDYIGGDISPASTLDRIKLNHDEAMRLFLRCFKNIELMLSLNIIHGDLSAYNILYWDGEITIIDFPQVVDPKQNKNAFTIFSRDITRICEYFSSQGIGSDPEKLAKKIWVKYKNKLGPNIDLKFFSDSDEDLAYWNTLNK